MVSSFFHKHLSLHEIRFVAASHHLYIHQLVALHFIFVPANNFKLLNNCVIFLCLKFDSFEFHIACLHIIIALLFMFILAK